MRLPDYLIIGTMKGGTTAMHGFINAHPGVTPPTTKEIHYFTLNYHRGAEWYSSHFDPAAAVTGEGSPTYFDAVFTAQVPQLIDRDLPNAKLILVVRDPVERAVSHFNHLQNTEKRPCVLGMSADEFFSKAIARSMTQETPLAEARFQVMYFSAVSRKYDVYCSVVGESRMLVVGNAQLRHSAQQVMDGVFDYLGLESFSSPFFNKVVYSHGSDELPVALETRTWLQGFFAKDYERFLRRSRSRQVVPIE